MSKVRFYIFYVVDVLLDVFICVCMYVYALGSPSPSSLSPPPPPSGASTRPGVVWCDVVWCDVCCVPAWQMDPDQHENINLAENPVTDRCETCAPERCSECIICHQT